MFYLQFVGGIINRFCLKNDLSRQSTFSEYVVEFGSGTQSENKHLNEKDLFLIRTKQTN